MAGSGRIHDRVILDALEAIDPEPFTGTVWRVTRQGREPLRGAAAHGRWSPGGEFEVLYTSLERDGALAEIGYRLSLEPVWPSRIAHEIHAIEVQAEWTLRFVDTASLAPSAWTSRAIGSLSMRRHRRSRPPRVSSNSTG